MNDVIYGSPSRVTAVTGVSWCRVDWFSKEENDAISTAGGPLIAALISFENMMTSLMANGAALIVSPERSLRRSQTDPFIDGAGHRPIQSPAIEFPQRQRVCEIASAAARRVSVARADRPSDSCYHGRDLVRLGRCHVALYFRRIASPLSAIERIVAIESAAGLFFVCLFSFHRKRELSTER